MTTKISRKMFAPDTPMHEIGDYTWSARLSKAGWLLCQGQAVSRSTYAALFSEIGVTYGAGDGSTTFNLPDGQGRALIGSGAGLVIELLAASAFNTATDRITIASNADRWFSGAKVRFTTTGTLPGGIAAATDYYINRVSSTEIRLSATLADALAGNIIDITSQGTGTHTMTQTLTSRAAGDKGGEEAHALSIFETPAHTHPLKYSTATYTSGAGTMVGTVGTGGSTATSDASGGSSAHNNMPPFLAANLFIFAGV